MVSMAEPTLPYEYLEEVLQQEAKVFIYSLEDYTVSCFCYVQYVALLLQLTFDVTQERLGYALFCGIVWWILCNPQQILLSKSSKFC